MLPNKLLQWSLFLMLVFISLLLSGCLKFSTHLTVHTDGSGDMEIVLLQDAAVNILSDIHDPFADFKDNLAGQGFSISPYRENGMSGIKAVKTMTNEELMSLDLSDFLGGNPGSRGQVNAGSAASNSPFLTVKEEFLLKRYYLDLVINFDRILPYLDHDYIDRYSDMILTLMQPDIRFIITLPVRPESHNAAVVSDDGKTMEWLLALKGDNDIRLVAVVPNFNNIAKAVVITGAALIVTVIFIIFIRHRR